MNIFQRIDVCGRRRLNSLDFVTFFRDNHLVVSEQDCYMLVKQCDSNNDGMMSLVDLMKLIAPRCYTQTKNLKDTKKYAVYAHKPAKLTHEIEFGVT